MDFVIDTGSEIIPVAVKAEVNLQAKSLKVYREKFEPKVSVRASMAEYKQEDWLVNLPLWAVEVIEGRDEDQGIAVLDLLDAAVKSVGVQSCLTYCIYEHER